MLYNDNIKQFYIINQLQITIKNKFIDFYNIFFVAFYNNYFESCNNSNF